MIFETHAHYDDKAFDEDREELIKSLKEKNICNVINVSAELDNIKKTVELTKKYDFFYGAAGVHPSEVYELKDSDIEKIEAALLEPKMIAVGEIGLDYYWDKEPEKQAIQRDWFGRQIELAKRLNKPIIVHSRDAANDTMKVMEEHKAFNVHGVIHCYSYSKEIAQEFVKRGYYIGVGGVVTFKNARKLVETVEAIPLEKILIETDCPYMAPEPYRGKRNYSGYLEYVVDKIAEIKGISGKEVEEITRENARTLFRV